MLHIINSNSGHEVLFARIAEGDALLFMANAVLGLHQNSQLADVISANSQRLHFFALEADLIVRGLSATEILPEIQIVDYRGFVTLTIEHNVIKTWN